MPSLEESACRGVHGCGIEVIDEEASSLSLGELQFGELLRPHTPRRTDPQLLPMNASER